MEANGYQQQQPGYPQQTAVGYYAPPPGVGSGQPPRVFANKSKKERARSLAKSMTIADIVISSVSSAIWLAIGIRAYPHAFAGLLFFYTGSIIGSILILTLPKKKWPAIFWVFWNIFRIIAELVVPIVCGIYWVNRPGHRTEYEYNRDAVHFILVLFGWIIFEISMLSTYITFVYFIRRYWSSFNEPDGGTGTEFRPRPTAPAGQPLPGQQPPEYQYQQYQNPPPPQY